MSRGYTGKSRKGKGFIWFGVFCVFAFALTFTLSYFAHGGKIRDSEPRDISLSEQIDNLFEQEITEEDKNVFEVKNTKKEKETKNITEKEKTEKKSESPKTNTENVVADASENTQTEETEDISVSAQPELTVVPLKNGKILGGYSEKAEYSDFFEDWRTHRGVDIEGKQGESVYAIADGVVSESYIDPIFGGTLKLDCGSFVCTYMGLNSENMEMKGTVLKKGDILGALDGIIPGESSKVHLHFEVSESGKTVDPIKYIG